MSVGHAGCAAIGNSVDSPSLIAHYSRIEAVDKLAFSWVSRSDRAAGVTGAREDDLCLDWRNG